MAYTNYFFIDQSRKKMARIYKSLSEEFKNDLVHIESSYKDLLIKDTEVQLLIEVNELKNKMSHLLSHFIPLFLKNERGFTLEINNLKIKVLSLKAKLMMHHILWNHNQFDINHFVLVTNSLHNRLEEFSHKLLTLSELDDAADATSARSKYQDYFEQTYGVLRQKYEELSDTFSIGDSLDYSSDEEKVSLGDFEAYHPRKTPKLS